MAQTATRTDFSTSLLQHVKNIFNAIGRGMIKLAEANSRQHTVEKLREMSDEQLAQRGLRRDTIVQHVYRDYLYI